MKDFLRDYFQNVIPAVVILLIFATFTATLFLFVTCANRGIVPFICAVVFFILVPVPLLVTVLERLSK